MERGIHFALGDAASSGNRDPRPMLQHSLVVAGRQRATDARSVGLGAHQAKD